MQTRRVAFVIAAVLLCACFSAAHSRFEDFVHGAFHAELPEGWVTETITEPGVRVLVVREDPEHPATSADLLWIEVTTFAGGDVRAFVTSMLENVGLNDVESEDERGNAQSYELALRATFQGEPVAAVFLGHEDVDRLSLFAFSAPSEAFAALGGRDFLLAAFEGRVRPPQTAAGVDTPKASTVLARAGEFTLTAAMVANTVAFAEFLAATRFSAEERTALRAAILEEFAEVTAEDHEAFVGIGTIMRELPKRGGVARAKLRRQLLTRIWMDLQGAEESSILTDLVFRYNPILGVDEQLGLVATCSAYDALIASNNFICERSGLEPIGLEQRAEVLSEAPKVFAGLNEKDKELLANAEVRWATTIRMWQVWNEAEQAKSLRLAGLARIENPDQVPRVARDFESVAGMQHSVKKVQELVGIQADVSVLEYFRTVLLD